MRTCKHKNCTNSLELFHRSRLYCDDHKYNKRVPKPLKMTVTMTYERFKQFERDSETLREIKEKLCYLDNNINHK